MVLLFCSPEIPQKFIYRMVLLCSKTFYFNHISNIINTIVELNINNRSKISYLSSLIFQKNRDVYKWCFQPPESVEFREKIQGRIFCEVTQKTVPVYPVKTTGTAYKKSEPQRRSKPMVLHNNQLLKSPRGFYMNLPNLSGNFFNTYAAQG